MQIKRVFTQSDVAVENQIEWKRIEVSIKDGDRVVLQNTIEVPKSWSQSAAEILAHKYLRKAGVPSFTVVATDFVDTPAKLKPSKAAQGAKLGAETSAKQVFHRLAGHWAFEGFKNNYFDVENASIFYDEVYYMLANQMAAPNSPQWFNTGLWWAYGIVGGAGHGSYHSYGIGMEANEAAGVYIQPQTSACFILGIRDSLLGDGGITDTCEREARIFKYGSGAGTNYSSLRGKNAKLSNGGVSSGLMSFLKVFDASAGAIKSGGTTRRAAKMAIVDADHPEAEDFVTWKQREEIKVAAMVAGAKTFKGTNEIARATLASISEATFEGEAYNTVSGQNANNSLRVTDNFMRAVCSGLSPDTTPLYKMDDLWKKAVAATWACGDPGLQFHDTINAWHTIPKKAPIRASNPCSEYMFIDDSSCNLASLNLVKFLTTAEDMSIYFDADLYEHAIRLWTIVLDISVSMSSFPDKTVAENSMDYRAIGLGYANLGGLLMLVGAPYDSEEGRTYAGLVTAVMHGRAWRTSKELASELGAFRDFEVHAEDVARVLEQHRVAARALASGSIANSMRPETSIFAGVLRAVESLWCVGDVGGEFGYLSGPIRNAQLTLLAPTGTIGFVMGVATTGIEPDFSLVKYKRLAGGGSMTLVNELVPESLRNLGYEEVAIQEITDYIKTSGRVDKACPHIKVAHIPVFNCANDIDWHGHISMMAAVQPFLSGAISKTVNMVNSATEADVGEAFRFAWKKGLKAIAIYRDGCKLAQPLTAVRADTAANQPLAQDAALVGSTVSTNVMATVAATLTGRKGKATRYKLPSRRNGFTQKVTIGGQSLYMRTGEYPDGKLGEIFLTLGRDGTTMRHLLDSLAVALSIGLQHGVPLQEYVDAFSGTRSDPCGMVQGSENVRMCSSLLDYVVRELDKEYGAKDMEEDTENPAKEDVVSALVLKEALDVTVGNIINETVTNVTTLKPATDAIEDGNFLKAAEPRKLVITKPAQEAPRALSGSGVRTMAKPLYTGDACKLCGAVTMRRSGTCFVCDTCGETTGCS